MTRRRPAPCDPRPAGGEIRGRQLAAALIAVGQAGPAGATVYEVSRLVPADPDTPAGPLPPGDRVTLRTAAALLDQLRRGHKVRCDQTRIPHRWQRIPEPRP